jgi:hypothetical protein
MKANTVIVVMQKKHRFRRFVLLMPTPPALVMYHARQSQRGKRKEDIDNQEGKVRGINP